MAFLTVAKARAAAGQRSSQVMESELRKAAATDTSTSFDVFLSHSIADAEVILGVKEILEAEGLRVYVDWVEDRQLDRSRVTPQTADLLRTRMRHSLSLMFASSEASSTSKWMPWELGFFDGFRPGHVAILPLVDSPGQAFLGQEYLGLYPYVEDINFSDRADGLGIRTGAGRARPIGSWPRYGMAP